MTVAEGLAGLRPIGFQEAGVGLRQVHREDVDPALSAPNDGPRLAEVDLGMAGIVGQGYEDLPAALPALPRT